MTRQEFEDNLVELAAKHTEQSRATVEASEHYIQTGERRVAERRNLIAAAANPNAPVIQKPGQGKQSDLKHRFDLLDPHAMFSMTHVLHQGEVKYGPDNWRKIPVEDHLNHAMAHIMAWLSGDHSDEHLAHLMCRAMFAAGVEATTRLAELDAVGYPEQEIGEDF